MKEFVSPTGSRVSKAFKQRSDLVIKKVTGMVDMDAGVQGPEWRWGDK